MQNLTRQCRRFVFIVDEKKQRPRVQAGLDELLA